MYKYFIEVYLEKSKVLTYCYCRIFNTIDDTLCYSQKMFKLVNGIAITIRQI